MKSKPALALCAGIVLSQGAAANAADIVIGLPNWPSASASAHILEAAIEQNYQLDVELQNGTNPVFYEGMDRGSVHVHPEVVLPNQQNLHDTYVKERGTVAFSQNGFSGAQGMCISKAVRDELGVDEIQDLTDPEVAALFDTDGDGLGEVWIGAPGWASTTIEKIRARSYAYDETFELKEMDSALMLAELDAAMKAGEPYAFFCYTPHHVFTLYDVVMLDEPAHDEDAWTIVTPTEDPQWLEKSQAAVAWPATYYSIHYATSLEQDYPEVARFLQNVSFSAEQVTDMMYALAVENTDPADLATTWLEENQSQVLEWVSN